MQVLVVIRTYADENIDGVIPAILAHDDFKKTGPDKDGSCSFSFSIQTPDSELGGIVDALQAAEKI